ncbi:DNA polymerase III subunits gamma and tau [Serinicoccus hydrothermalis]|uniref:DNA polymerase III subunit gamma/tau n=1 Tax=Serinicoccus hydrothermalis TaxID=1758689 RepID=A0A1B1NBW1_9MICO|nr:DNA polymerase III subunit gamma and tau [Serinicoccus hydrothermalis]ANS78918.1 DNA polymerase III subunits gamma and tau [Serinicoccus hydrothermalis]
MSTALYRRYRPETFTDVIGQEHVTEPLMQALRAERVNHAYLFSGPRGCGKTTSARILARCLNCEQGPTPEPCGQCESCVALARDGAGSVDVIEIDAASHGRVDDTRELRERAAFGPATARYKIYIIDEAHMVSREGFNSLLKIVEEPPPHVKFIFATTEPEKVLATIRSRTHHYPFHLVPPQRLTAYLEQLCEAEGVELEPGVLSFVTRAGGGSVRDSLSVLDQLISGAGEGGLTYERTAALLGFTDVELLDAVVEAVAAGDAATVFGQIDRVMESGHDPRRFVEDLLERYRDLIVLAAVGERSGGLLPGLPEDQVERMRRQAQAYGTAALSRAGDLVSRGLSEMTGAVSSRLMLELLAARLLLPGAEGEDGYGTRLERIERRLGAGDPAEGSGRRAAPAAARRDQTAATRVEPDRVEIPEPADTQQPGHLDTAAVRRQWPEIIAAVRQISRRTAGALESMQVVDFDGSRLLIGMPDERWIRHFMGTSHEEALRQGVIDALALDIRIEATARGGEGAAGPAGGTGSAPGGPPSTGPAPGDEPPPEEPDPGPEPEHEEPGSSGPPPQRSAGTSDQEAGRPPQQPAGTPQEPRGAATGLPDTPMRGRIRTRGDRSSAAAGAAGATDAGQGEVRVRGRGTRSAEEPGGGTRPGDAGLAEQLGAGAARPQAADQPEWSQQTSGGQGAPAWATGQPEASTSTSPDPSRPDGAGPEATPPTPSAADEPAPAPARSPGGDAPSDDDEDLATSGAVGQPVVESVLGGTVIAINDDPVA